MNTSAQENNQLSVEQQITHHLHLMKEELENVEGPNFKRFWEIRKECLKFFKFQIAQQTRAKLWENYIVLADEARMAREHVEEDSKFVTEQLDLAIDALEKEIETLEQSPENLFSTLSICLPPSPKSLEAHNAHYMHSHKHIQALTLFGSKIHELRKELIKMPVRMRIKAKGYDRLSKLGDRIFPVRKQMVEDLSTRFKKDIERFAQEYFSVERFDHDKVKRSLFFFREEIKKMQALGAALSLNSIAFVAVRKQLSACWDQLKGMEKEIKKELSEHKSKSAENAKIVREKIEICKAKLPDFSLEALSAELQSIHLFMKDIDLVRADVVALKEELVLLAAPLKEQENKEKEERLAKEAAAKAAKTLLFDQWLQKLEQFKVTLDEGQIPDLISQHALYKKEIQELRMDKTQHYLLEKELKSIGEKIGLLKEKRLLSLSAEDKNALEILRSALAENKEIRKLIKHNLEDFRKKKGSRGLDVSQALELEELVEIEKERLAKIDLLIEELENKISSL